MHIIPSTFASSTFQADATRPSRARRVRVTRDIPYLPTELLVFKFQHRRVVHRRANLGFDPSLDCDAAARHMRARRVVRTTTSLARAFAWHIAQSRDGHFSTPAFAFARAFDRRARRESDGFHACGGGGGASASIVAHSSRAFASSTSRDARANGGEAGVNVDAMGGDPPPPDGFDVVREGAARVLQRANDVFYNKPQVVNRDLSLAVIREYQRVRADEHANGLTKRNKRARGAACATARDDVLLEALTSEEEREAMFRTAEEHQAVKDAAAAKAAAAKAGNEDNGDDDDAAAAKEPLRALTILEGMSATGLRALRYAQELADVGCVVANDLDPKASEAIERNKAYNITCSPHLKEKISKVIPHNQDVRMVCMTHEKMFDVVDLDPYGSPSTLLDSAVQTVKEGGMLLVTATDMAVLCGNNGEVAWAKYGSYPLRAKYCHEMAVRTLLGAIANAAIKHKRHIVPVLSLSIDFYIRVFVRVYTSPLQMKNTPTKLSYVFQCVGCDSHELQPVGRAATKGNVTKYQPGAGPVVPQRCNDCGWHYNMGGPIWSDPIHDKQWVKNILAEVEKNKDAYPGYNKIHALLTLANEELLDVPLHYDLHSMGGTLKVTPPNAWLFKSAIINAGYRVSGTHSNPLGVKTDAPAEALWDILRCWVKDHPAKAQPQPTPGEAILAKEPKLIANWTRVPSAQSKSQREGTPRFPQNPEENWGPKRRAGTTAKVERVSKKARDEEYE